MPRRKSSQSRRRKTPNRGGCPRGQIRRRSYTTRRGTKVKAVCVTDVGKPGKTPPSERVLPELKPGRLRNYGYSTSYNAETRRKAITRAVRAEGYASIIRRIVAASNYMKRSAPTAHRKMRADLKWAQKNLAPKYSASAMRRRRRRSSSR